MAGSIDARLSELGIELPNAAAPAANYVPYVISGKTLYVSGQVPFWNGELKGVGKVGKDQIEDYARRKKQPLDVVEKWLMPNLDYQ